MQNTTNRHRRSNYRGSGRPAGGSFSRSRSRFQGGRRPQPARRGRKMPTFNPAQFINTNPSDEKAVVYEPKHTFRDFNLDNGLNRNINAMGLIKPSHIQDQIIPEILAGHDVVGIAETGTGKTAAFLVPLIQKTIKEYRRQTLILTPTRELAIQIEQELRRLSVGCKIFSTVCVGGANIRPQIRQLRRKNHFIIGTPGRIQDLIERNDLRTDQVTTIVLDEADRMLDMGFINPIREIISDLKPDHESLFFSATMDERAKSLVNEFLNNPVVVSVKKRDVTNSIKQDVVRHEHNNKFDTLVSLLKKDLYKRVIIFGAMKHSVEKLAEELKTKGITAESLHGNKNHSQRQRALSNFKSGHAQVLVATDVAARGIHVDNVSHVINYDLPNTFEDYVHRIGRTGRGDKRGEAITFIPA